jgi:DNA integrity scanning protein DisA with diadenylate cyclase activity
LEAAGELALEVQAEGILVVADAGLPKTAVLDLNQICQTLVVTRNATFLKGIEENGVRRLYVDYDVDADAPFERVRQAMILGMEGGFIKQKSRLVCLASMVDRKGVDSLMVLDTRHGFEGVDPERIRVLAGNLPIEVVKSVLDLALEIGSEGREGEPVGTLFVVGDSVNVMASSRSMDFDPFRGYSEREKNLTNRDIWEGVKEVALMDGAFIVQGDGVILSGCRYITADVQGLTLPKGLGARHVAAASMSKHTDSVAVAVSESTGTVRVFKGGQIVLTLRQPARRTRGNRG